MGTDTRPSLRNLPPEEVAALEPRTRKGLRSRSALQQAARELFREQGVAAARVSDMCARSGMSNGAFYRYFRDKDDMLRSLLEDFFSRLYELTSAPWEPGDPKRSVYLTTTRYLQQYEENADLYRVMIEAAQTRPDIEEVWNQARQSFYQRIARSLRRAQASGQAREGIDPDLAAALLGGMSEHYAYVRFVLLRGPDVDIETASQHIAELWAFGVFAPPGDPSAT